MCSTATRNRHRPGRDGECSRRAKRWRRSLPRPHDDGGGCLVNTQLSDLEPVGELDTLFATHPRLVLRWGTQDILRRYRAQEPRLVSSARDGSDVKVVLLEYDGALLGVASFFLETNARRATADNLFARVDLVIVPGSNRRRGVARALVLCVLTYLLGVHGDRLYSISCLAAHDAIVKILRDQGLQTRSVPERHFTHAELPITGQTRAGMRDRIARDAERALQAVNYRLRQGKVRSGRKGAG